MKQDQSKGDEMRTDTKVAIVMIVLCGMMLGGMGGYVASQVLDDEPAVITETIEVIEEPEDYTHLALCYELMVDWYATDENSAAGDDVWDKMDDERCFWKKQNRRYNLGVATTAV